MLRYLDDERPLKRYLEIKAEMKRLEEELRELQPVILAALWEEPDERAEYAGYELTVGARRTYAYSERVETLKKELKALKKQEEQDGTATLIRHTSFVVVRPLKKE
ncbi:hypothetical protein [Rhodocaloribacter sp.]